MRLAKNLVLASDSFARPTNTTPYTIGDSVAPASLTLTDATNAAPIVVTSAAHGLSSGDPVTIASVVGNTAANGDWVITVVDANSFSLNGSTGNGVYISGGTLNRLLDFTSVVQLGRTGATIVKTRLVCNSATVTNGTFRVYFFNARITQIADNAAWTELYANRAKLVGYTGTITLITGGAGSDSGVGTDLTQIPFLTTSGLFAVIVAEAAYVPTSGELFYLELTIEQ